MPLVEIAAAVACVFHCMLLRRCLVALQPSAAIVMQMGPGLTYDAVVFAACQPASCTTVYHACTPRGL